MGKGLHIETWGCQMNAHQSEGIAGLMKRAGYTLVSGMEKADVVLFNGCMVRQRAEEKVYGRIGAVVDEKRRRDLLLGVGGCLGQVRSESLLSRFPAIDFVFGSRGYGSLPGLIERVEREGARIACVDERTGVEELPFERVSPVTAMVTIAEGCSNFCSYCVVPYARGPMRSRAPERILDEVEDAVASGCREVLLLGQNVNSYGEDRREYGDFAALLGRVAETGVTRVRFTSSHPRDTTREVLETMSSYGNICNHLHLACQSGSDRILRAMNRGYSREAFLSIVRTARRLVPGLNVTTDLIVGYPGETEDDFEATMALIEDARFGSVYVAKYSARPLTRSSRIEEEVSEGVKDERLHRVLSRQRSIALEENERFIGRDVEVLVEGNTSEGERYGRATDHRTVAVHGDGPRGEIVLVRIEAASRATLSGVALVPEEVRGAR
jgi:tRNA-2-methylthio-N6-dimethylallyladenosine synthase